MELQLSFVICAGYICGNSRIFSSILHYIRSPHETIFHLFFLRGEKTEYTLRIHFFVGVPD